MEPPPDPTAITPPPSISSEIVFLNDEWQTVDIPFILTNGANAAYLAYTNFNDRERIVRENQTPEPLSDFQTLYYYRPDIREQTTIAEIPISAEDRIFPSPDGTRIMFFAEPSADYRGGLYLLDYRIGLRYRLFDLENLSPRGIRGHLPVWSADGNRLAIVLPTNVATDVFVMNADGTNFRNMSESFAYDLYPAFSPDGTWLAYVSNRNDCLDLEGFPTAPCEDEDGLPPIAGNLFIYNLNTGEQRQVTDLRLNGTPRWLTPSLLEFSTSGGNALAEDSELWLVDVDMGSAVQISDSEAFSTGQSWASDASRVVYQRIGETTELVLGNDVGGIEARTEEFTFSRFGMASDWSLDDSLIAIGGRNGQCPYGLIVMTPELELARTPSQNLLACDPTYGPGGRFLAFTGIRPGTITDGRLDIYIADINGLGVFGLTTSLQGEVNLLGWVGTP